MNAVVRKTQQNKEKRKTERKKKKKKGMERGWREESQNQSSATNLNSWRRGENRQSSLKVE